MKKVYLLLISLLLLFGLIGCGKPTEIEVNSYVEVSFTGYDTLGKIEEYDFDARKMLSDFEKELEDASKKEIEKLLLKAIKFKNDTELKNGDEVTVTWDIDEDDLAEFEEEYNVKLIFSDFTVEVDDLEKMDSFDPFENVNIYYEGYAPCGLAYLDILYSSNSGINYYYDFSYQMDKRENLSNGDVITVTVSAYGEADFVNFCVEEYGKIPSVLTKEFTVSGLPTYVTDVKDIPTQDLAALDQHIQNFLKEDTAGWVNPDSFYGTTLMGNVFAQKTYQDYYSYVENKLYFIYKVDVDTVQDGAFAYYYYGSLSNLKLDENGKLIYSENDITVPEKYGSWYVSGTYFTKSNLYYEGYETYDALYAAEIEPLTKNYDTIVNNVDTSVITKVTHEPNDYSKITDTLELSADSFTYKWYQGSYFVSGLTEAAYQKIMEYTVADYVSIKLPAATADGSVVEGFYSSSAEGGYAFSELVCDDAPRFELVCADTYATFYGFCDDNYFNNANLYKMKGIKLNDGIKELKARAFQNCQTLECVTLPEGLEIIPEYLFVNCYALKEVNIPSSVTEIQAYAFSGCNALVIEELTLDSIVIGYRAFDGVTLKKVTLVSDNYVPQRYSSWGDADTSLTNAVIDELVISEGVTKIPDYAFEQVNSITEVTLPSSVKSIGMRAFAECNGLTKITMPEGLETIGGEAFYGCDVLKTAELPTSVVTISEKAFYECVYLSISSFDIGTKDIGNEAFYGVAIQELIFSDETYVSQASHGWYTYAPFMGAVIKKLTINEGVTVIPDYTFEYCTSLEEVTLPSSLKTIGVRAFAECDGLKKIVMQEGLETIGEETFYGCEALKTAEIPASVMTIGEKAFYGCTYLSIKAFDIGVKFIGNEAFNNVTIQELIFSDDTYASQATHGWYIYTPFMGAIVKKLTINEGVTVIPDYTFEYCASLTEVTLPSTLKSIGIRAFAECGGLKTVIMPEGLKTISDEAFYYCEALKNVELPASVESIGNNVFYGTSVEIGEY